MSAWQSEKTTLISRTTSILNSEVLSDVQFVVGPDGVVFHAHKLLLSLASPVFEQRFNEHLSDDHLTLVKVPDIVPMSFFKMLQYIYIDKLELHDIREANNLLAAAEKFKIEHLKQLCQDYIKARDVPPQLVCRMYEIATEWKMTAVLKFCCHAFTKHTKEVLSSASFVEAKASTVNDLISNGSLSCDERDLLEAVMKWGKTECCRRGLQSNGSNIRCCINPFMPQLRFLSLSLSEVKPFIEIFTQEEVFEIITWLSGGDYQLKAPPSFLCSNTNKRSNPVPEQEFKVKSLPSILTPKKLNNLQFTRAEPPVKEREISFLTDEERNLLCDNEVKCSTNNDQPITNAAKRRSDFKNNVVPFFSQSGKHRVIYSDSENSTDSDELKATETLLKWTQYSVMDMMLDRYMSIPGGIALKDVTSTLELIMKSGKICVTGLNIGLKNAGEQSDSKQVIVRLEKNGDTYEEEHNSSVINANRITFHKPLHLSADDIASIKTTISSLQLNQCCVSGSGMKTFDKNNILFDVCMRSNQKSFNKYFPFLISQIVFSHN